MQHIDLKENGKLSLYKSLHSALFFLFHREKCHDVAKGFAAFWMLAPFHSFFLAFFNFTLRPSREKKKNHRKKCNKRREEEKEEEKRIFLLASHKLKIQIFILLWIGRFNFHSFIHSMILLKAAEWESKQAERKKLVFTLVSLSDVLSAKGAQLKQEKKRGKKKELGKKHRVL